MSDSGGSWPGALLISLLDEAAAPGGSIRRVHSLQIDAFVLLFTGQNKVSVNSLFGDEFLEQ